MNKQKPAHEIRIGRNRATLWANVMILSLVLSFREYANRPRLGIGGQDSPFRRAGKDPRWCSTLPGKFGEDRRVGNGEVV